MKLPLVVFAVFLAGCAGKPASRYSVDQDYGPENRVDVSHVPDAVPRFEPRSRGGNRSPYRVWGRSYQVMDNSEGFRETGIASWYGKKFHGHDTANGEVYDMYAMTAAHKHLPLPTYVRVTNLENQRQVVVRVNDRGPFHEGRVIDLSYAAAARLDMLSSGTAQVQVEAIQVAPSDPAASSGATDLPRRFLQVGAYSTWSAAQSVKTELGLLPEKVPVVISKREGERALYRVRLGPIPASFDLDRLQKTLQSKGFQGLPVVDLP